MKQVFALTTLLVALVLVGVPGHAQNQYPNGYYGQQQNWRGALPPDDQKKFDDYYSKWVDASRKNDRDDIEGNARHMQDIMTHNNIPANVPFDQIASNPAPMYGNQGAYPGGAYPNGAYPYPGNGARFSAEDQGKFDKAYEKWIDSQRKNDQDDVSKHAREMEQIMARYNIPSNVPFAALATNGYANGANGAAGYPYGNGQGAQRLSSKDQSDFDKAYQHWVDARRKKDMDDVDKNARKMQEIMARYNIPADVPFDRIASVSPYHH